MMKMRSRRKSHLLLPTALLQLLLVALWVYADSGGQYNLTVTDTTTGAALPIFATTNGTNPQYVTNYLAIDSSMTNSLLFAVDPSLNNVYWDFGHAMDPYTANGNSVVETLMTNLPSSITPVTIQSDRTDENGVDCHTSQTVLQLLPVQIAIQKQGASAPPTNGVLVKNGDTLQIALNPGLLSGAIAQSDYPFTSSQVAWKYCQLNGDGTFGAWTSFGSSGNGVMFNYTTATSGIFQVEAIVTVNGSPLTYQYVRQQDDPNGKDSTGTLNTIYKKGQPDYFGVVDNQWQIDVRNKAVAQLGSTAYAKAGSLVPPIYPGAPTFAGDYKCNIFVYMMCNAAGDAPVPLVTHTSWGGLGTTYSVPPNAKTWYQGTISGWTSLGTPTSPQPGEVISRPEYSIFGGVIGGHSGIVDYDGAWINAGTDNVNRYPNITPSGNPYNNPEHCSSYTGP